jgi:hypothetical protein
MGLCVRPFRSIEYLTALGWLADIDLVRDAYGCTRTIRSTRALIAR